MCYPYTYNPFLVLTSDSLINNYFKKVNTTDGVFLEQQFNTFSNSSFSGKLCDDGRAYDSCKALQECLNQNPAHCLHEWEIYSNNYWETFKDMPVKEPLIGLEQYQIPLKYGTIIQPRFIDNNNSFIHGPHIIIGGGFEDEWGYGYLSENIARSFIPNVFKQFFPFYGLFIFKI